MNMKMNIRKLVIAGITAFGLGFASVADSVIWNGNKIEFSNASEKTVGGDLVLTFSQSGSLTLYGDATSRILLVGGGGSGARSNSNSNSGYGGQGGYVIDNSNVSLPKGEYEITIGSGGMPQTQNSRSGNNGGTSSIIGNGKNLNANGGAGGTVSGNPSSNSKSSNITGETKTYGVTGDRNATTGTQNTGNGGGGSRKGTNSGAGGSGVVIVRISSIAKPVHRDTKSINVLDGELTLDGDYGEILSAISTDENVVEAYVMNGKVHLIPVSQGVTDIIVETPSTTYVISVNCERLIQKRIELAKGPDSGTSYSYELESISNIVVESGHDVVSVVQDGNVVQISALNPGIANVKVYGNVEGGKNSTLDYEISVREVSGGIVELNGNYVEYVGASVISNSDSIILVYTNVDYVGSFTIPSPFMARVDTLLVGGGGSGGSAIGFGHAGAGGGAGGYVFVSNSVFASGKFDVKVGKGGKAPDNIVVGAGIQGITGSSSEISNSFGHVVSIAYGGGGGGCPGISTSIDGLKGGSGGGATSYEGSIGQYGIGIPGQGHNGGKPENAAIAGGGGGAGGLGSSNGLGGQGIENSITGISTAYAQGGNGGLSYAQKSGSSGQGFGFGGEGGSGNLGGSGGAGVVIVKITDLYRNVKVPVPGTNVVYSADGKYMMQDNLVTPRFVWTNGEVCVALDMEWKTFRSSTDSESRFYSDVFDVISGNIETNCYYTGKTDPDGNPELGGVGYYSFTLKLKDGYSWEDGMGLDSPGTTENKAYRWVVVADESVIDASIDIHKTISWSSSSNATVSITTFTSPEMSGGGTPKVLMLGTLCSTHGLTANTIKKSIEAIVEAADVDYYFYKNSDCQYSASLKKNQPVSQNFTVGANAHFALLAFYRILYEKLVVNKEKYDYIVFEFDGSRLGKYYDGTYNRESFPKFANEREVADALIPFYSDGNVIWIMDNAQESGEEEVFDNYWKPNTYFYSAGSGELNDVQYHALVGLFDPISYSKGNTREQICVEKKTVRSGWFGSTTYYANTRNDLQANYNNPDAVTDLLRNTIKVKPYNLNLKDKIVSPEKGLSISGITIQVNTNGVNNVATSTESDWANLITWKPDGSTAFTPAKGINGASISVDLSSNLVQSVISNVDFTVWTRVSISVVDDGKFRTTEDAYYNQFTGKWEKNPNEGKAFAEMFDGMGIAMNVDGDAETDTPWEFTTKSISASVINGQAFVGGENVLSMGYAEGSTVTVYYRGSPGYKISRLIVDGNPVDVTLHQISYTFSSISEDHHIDIEYEPFFGTVITSPVTNMYDGTMHFYDVKLEGWDESYSNEVRYAIEDLKYDTDAYLNAEDFANTYGMNLNPGYDKNELTDVGVHRFYCRVYVLQQGYGETIDQPGWVWVDTSICDANCSVITPATLTVKPNDSDVIKSDEALPDIGYSFSGFIGNEKVSDVIAVSGVTNAWKVISTYKVGDGVGMYLTWVADSPIPSERHSEHQFIIQSGDPDCVNPDEHVGNVGNYYFIPIDNFQPVELIPLSIGNVLQGPNLNPENPLVDTGVDKVTREYDGVSTNIFVDVTSKDVESGRKLVQGEDYVIRYSIAGADDPKTPISDWSESNPEFSHAGTNVVWYWVEPINGQERIYFSATNYQYVVVSPRKIELESLSNEWTFDGTSHSHNVIRMNSENLVNGDSLETNTISSIVHAGEVENDFIWNIVSGDPTYSGDPRNDYDVTMKFGKLKVNPKAIEVNGYEYPSDPTQVAQYGHSGVEDAIKTYDGIPTNINVMVDVPTSSDEYRIVYSTNYCGDATIWREDPYSFTNVIDIAVFFQIIPIGEHFGDYIPGTGFARVKIVPAKTEVVAQAEYILVGDQKPDEYDVEIGKLACPEDEIRKEELIDSHIESLDVPSYSVGSGVGEYPIEFVGIQSVITQGNYEVTYVPGTLHVVDRPSAIGLWITDHADAGDGLVHLQFEPKFDVEMDNLTAWAYEQFSSGRVWVVFAKDIDDIRGDSEKCVWKKASLRSDLEYPVDENDGRIWITVDEMTDEFRVSKIVIRGK